MPNWCSNEIVITGNSDNISAIENVIKTIDNKDETSVFRKLVGTCPDVSHDDYQKEGWYDANIKYWGTKWDVSINDCAFDFDEETIIMSPDTAWGPPVNFCITLSREYDVEVEAMFYEAGNNFAGKVVIVGGVIVEELDYTYYEGIYHLQNDLFWIEVKHEMIEEITIEELLDKFHFVSDTDKILIREMWSEFFGAKNVINP